jgi:hypothetical protein
MAAMGITPLAPGSLLTSYPPLAGMPTTKVLLVALVGVAAAQAAAPSHADWLAAIEVLDPEIRDGLFALITEGSSRRELQSDETGKPKSWNGVGGKMKINVKTEKRAKKALKKIAKKLDYKCGKRTIDPLKAPALHACVQECMKYESPVPLALYELCAL